jgi:hypothetical protein
VRRSAAALVCAALEPVAEPFVCAAFFLTEKQSMNALLIYPEFPDTFWSFKHALEFLGKLAAQPPLGVITVTALLS